jgi:hypothetical protein
MGGVASRCGFIGSRFPRTRRRKPGHALSAAVWVAGSMTVRLEESPPIPLSYVGASASKGHDLKQQMPSPSKARPKLNARRPPESRSVALRAWATTGPDGVRMRRLDRDPAGARPELETAAREGGGRPRPRDPGRGPDREPAGGTAQAADDAAATRVPSQRAAAARAVDDGRTVVVAYRIGPPTRDHTIR